jgi:hypothetical protein
MVWNRKVPGYDTNTEQSTSHHGSKSSLILVSFRARPEEIKFHLFARFASVFSALREKQKQSRSNAQYGRRPLSEAGSKEWFPISLDLN